MEHILYLRIENNIHSARVTAILDAHHQLYHVAFEDGYENIFFTDVETGKWIEEDLGETELAASIGERVSLFTVSHQARKPLTWCRAEIADMIINFGFYAAVEKRQTTFEIFTDNHKFLCSLIKDKYGTWEVHGLRRPATEYQYTNLVQIIISILESMADQHKQ